MAVDENRQKTKEISVSSLNRLNCGLCQVMSLAFEKLAAWERPEYRNDKPNRDPRKISIKYGRNHFEIESYFYLWYSAQSLINSINLFCEFGRWQPDLTKPKSS